MDHNSNTNFDMKTLTLNFTIKYQVGIRLKGFSLKVRNTHNFIICDIDGYALDCISNINSKHAQPEFDYLISELKNVYYSLPFDRIKCKGHYYKTSEEILTAILSHE